MASAEFSLNGFDEFENLIGGSPDALEASLLEEALELAEIIAGDARELAPVGDTGGTLRNSIVSFVFVSENEIVAGAGTDLEYGKYVEFGTGPTGTEAGGHPLDNELGIVRKQGKWRVKIPDVGVRWTAGQSAQPFMYPAMKNNEELIMKRFGTKLEEVLNIK